MQGSTTDARAALQSEIDALGPWFHNLHLPNGLQTAPAHPFGDFPSFKWKAIASYLPQRLDGMTVLDVGCNAGFYSIELARRGATVTAIDIDDRYLRQAEWASTQFGVRDRITFHRMQVYDLVRLDGSFDIVWFMGVFYHLRYAMLGLDIVAGKTKRMLMFQTLTMPGDEVCEQDLDTDDIRDRDLLLDPGWPKVAFIEGEYMRDPTNWWAPNHAAAEAMLRSAGMRVTAHPAEEIYLCEPAQAQPGRWADAEFISATGRSAVQVSREGAA